MAEPPDAVAAKADDTTAFLVEESCGWFRDLLSEARPHLTSGSDLFALCLHALMLELGFVSELTQAEIVNLSWRKLAGYFLPYRLPSCSNDDDSDSSPAPRFRLSVFRLGPRVTKVHGLCLGDEKIAFFTTKLTPEDFVVGSGLEEEKSWSLKSVERLARVFKGEVGWPLMQAGRRLAGQQSGGLLALPAELGLHIVKHLGVSENRSSFSQFPVWYRTDRSGYSLNFFIDKKKDRVNTFQYR